MSCLDRPKPMKCTKEQATMIANARNKLISSQFTIIWQDTEGSWHASFEETMGSLVRTYCPEPITSPWCLRCDRPECPHC